MTPNRASKCWSIRKRRPDEPVAQLILVHGLEGSSAAGYARSLAQAALEAGCATHRFNMRSCGGTEHLSGRTAVSFRPDSDLLAVCSAAPRRTCADLPGRLLAGRQRGVEAGRANWARSALRSDRRRHGHFHAHRSGGLRPAARQTVQLDLRAPIPHAPEGARPRQGAAHSRACST